MTAQQKFQKALVDAPIYTDPIFATRYEPPVSKNTVCTVFYGVIIDLKKLLDVYPHCQYDPTNFAALLFRLTPAKSVMLTFAAGHCVLLGCRTDNEIQVCIRLYARMLEQTGHNPERYAIKICNNVMTANVPHRVDLARMHADNKGISCYTPDVFSGLVFRFEDLKVTVTCFASGKFNVVGFSKYENGIEAYKRAMEILPKYPEIKKLVAVQSADKQSSTTTANDRRILKKLGKASNANLEALSNTLIKKEIDRNPRRSKKRPAEVSTDEPPSTPRTRKRRQIVKAFSERPAQSTQNFQEFYARQQQQRSSGIGKSVFSAALASHSGNTSHSATNRQTPKTGTSTPGIYGKFFG